MTYDRGACWRCRFFEYVPDSDDDDSGVCRRYPPTPLVDDEGGFAALPFVEYTDWCGEFVEEG